jgi:hypothetical protein
MLALLCCAACPCVDLRAANSRIRVTAVTCPFTLSGIRLTYGLPFGQDRLIPVWVTTLAVLQKSRVIGFATPSVLLEYFELPKNGYHYQRIVQGFQRIFGATVFFGAEEQRQGVVLSDSARFHFFDHVQLWYNRDEPCNEPENIVTVSEAFYDEIDRHKIPVERRVVRPWPMLPARLIYMFGSFGEVGVLRKAIWPAYRFSEARARASNYDRKSTDDRGISDKSSVNGFERLRLGGRNAPRLLPLMVDSSSFHKAALPVSKFSRSPKSSAV